MIQYWLKILIFQGELVLILLLKDGSYNKEEQGSVRTQTGG